MNQQATGAMNVNPKSEAATGAAAPVPKKQKEVSGREVKFKGIVQSTGIKYGKEDLFKMTVVSVGAEGIQANSNLIRKFHNGEVLEFTIVAAQTDLERDME
jgi:hypothetical protein